MLRVSAFEFQALLTFELDAADSLDNLMTEGGGLWLPQAS
jgi:hypothetical protein